MIHFLFFFLLGGLQVQLLFQFPIPWSLCFKGIELQVATVEASTSTQITKLRRYMFFPTVKF